MLTKEQLLARRESLPIEVTVEGWPDTVLLRQPTFQEWHGLVAAMQGCVEAGGFPSAELTVKTLGICVATPAGDRLLTDMEAQALLRSNPAAVQNLFRKCWDTVLKIEGKVEAAEKN